LELRHAWLSSDQSLRARHCGDYEAFMKEAVEAGKREREPGEEG
jgi:hypothetical protein